MTATFNILKNFIFEPGNQTNDCFFTDVKRQTPFIRFLGESTALYCAPVCLEFYLTFRKTVVTPIHLYLIFWKIQHETFSKNQLGRIWFLVYFKVDIYCLEYFFRVQLTKHAHNLSVIDFWKSLFQEIDFWTWFLQPTQAVKIKFE